MARTNIVKMRRRPMALKEGKRRKKRAGATRKVSSLLPRRSPDNAWISCDSAPPSLLQDWQSCLLSDINNSTQDPPLDVTTRPRVNNLTDEERIALRRVKNHFGYSHSPEYRKLAPQRISRCGYRGCASTLNPPLQEYADRGYRGCASSRMVWRERCAPTTGMRTFRCYAISASISTA